MAVLITGGVFDIDGRIRGDEPGVPGHDGGHPHLRVPPARRLRIQGLSGFGNRQLHLLISQQPE